MKLHIWRYDATTPAIESPWIVSHHDGHGGLFAEAVEFHTWQEAVDYATDIRAVSEWAGAAITVTMG